MGFHILTRSGKGDSQTDSQSSKGFTIYHRWRFHWAFSGSHLFIAGYSAYGGWNRQHDHGPTTSILAAGRLLRL
jgi:hypothetical protein